MESVKGVVSVSLVDGRGERKGKFRGSRQRQRQALAPCWSREPMKGLERACSISVLRGTM